MGKRVTSVKLNASKQIPSGQSEGRAHRSLKNLRRPNPLALFLIALPLGLVASILIIQLANLHWSWVLVGVPILVSTLIVVFALAATFTPSSVPTIRPSESDHETNASADGFSGAPHAPTSPSQSQSTS
ncbi:MAG: hypothetical protein AAGD04_07105 [Pseudomonadota bacterium]